MRRKQSIELFAKNVSPDWMGKQGIFKHASWRRTGSKGVAEGLNASIALI